MELIDKQELIERLLLCRFDILGHKDYNLWNAVEICLRHIKSSPVIKLGSVNAYVKADNGKVHQLKIKREYYEAIISGQKKFELRKDDRGYAVGESLLLREWEKGRYTLRWIVVPIRYILRNCPEYGLATDHCILGIGHFTSGGYCGTTYHENRKVEDDNGKS